VILGGVKTVSSRATAERGCWLPDLKLAEVVLVETALLPPG
jgi:hypothetical protein